MIRQATIADASRIAEILIFSKRMNYRTIFRNDAVSFGEMQVYPLAKWYIDNPQELDEIWVYDEFVKGMIHISENQILELYVDSFLKIKVLEAPSFNLLLNRNIVILYGFLKKQESTTILSKTWFCCYGR